MPHRRRLVAGAALAAALVASSGLVAQATSNAAAEGSSEPSLERSTLPAAGRQTALLRIAEFGRYSISVRSAQGTALRVIDRMAGPGPWSGEAGARDGRVDLFLDRGEVRLETAGAELATGEAQLSVTRSRDRRGGGTEQLGELANVSEELADGEEISWWLEIPTRTSFVVEAAGRYLADLRLWQNGSWLVAAEPLAERVEPRSGRPLALQRLAARLEPGSYRLTAYGGAGESWSQGGREAPLFLRTGVPREPLALSERRTVSPFGFDRVLVPGAADYFRLALPESRAAAIEVATWNADAPFPEAERTASIDRESLAPETSLQPSARTEGLHVVTIRGEAGQPYLLQHFARARERELSGRGSYWVATVSAGSAADALDATAVLVELGDGKKRPSRIVARDVVTIGGAAGWARRCNLLGPSTLQVEVTTAGRYRFAVRSGAVQARLQPLLLDLPPGSSPPPLRPAPAEWDLEPGVYTLDLVPTETGVVEMELAPAGGAPPVAESPRPTAQLGVVALDAKRRYRLISNARPEVESGVLSRALPLDLAAALPLALGPGEEVELPVRADVTSTASARAEDGSLLDLALDGEVWSTGPRVAPGTHRLRVRSTSDRTLVASVGFVPLAVVPAPPRPSAADATSPAFAPLVPGTPQALDLARGEARTFLVAAERPALYRVETTGLLALEGVLRTRTQPALLQAAENGPGRNVALAAYLREGEYQLTLRPRGASAGHAGVAVALTEVEDGGELALGVPARADLEPTKAMAYRLPIRDSGRYRLRALGLRGDFAMRLEDAEGWPVAAPLVTEESTFVLPAGDFRLIVLPRDIAARAVVIAEPIVEAATLEGHGPHPLPLDAEGRLVWMEPAEGGERSPDRWRFSLPAAGAVRIELSDEMQGEVADGAGEIVARVPPGRPFDGELAAGDYELRAVCSRRNSHVAYRISVRPADLMEGMRRRVVAPGELAIAIGRAGVAELASFGRSDVRARLLDPEGRTLSVADDRPGDWNFLLQRRLEPGRYRLRVEPVARPSAETEVSLRLPAERVEPELVAPGRRAVALDDGIAVLPLALPANAELVAAGARAGESISLALEVGDGGGVFRTIGEASGRAVRLAAPVVPGSAARLRIVSLDRRPAEVTLTLHAGLVRGRSERELEGGLELGLLPGVDPPIAVGRVDLERDGCFRRSDGALLQALGPGTPFAAAPPTVASLERTLWFAMPGESARRVRAERAVLGSGAPLALVLPDGRRLRCDVADGGAAVVRLSALGGEPVVTDAAAGIESAALGIRRAVTALAAGKARAVELWNGRAGAVEAVLDAKLLLLEAQAAVGWGERSLRLAPGRAERHALPGSGARVRLTLDAGAVARLESRGRTAAVVGGDAGAATETLTGTADAVEIFPGAEESEATLEVLPSGAGFETLAEGRFESRFDAAGRDRLDIAAGGVDRRLELRGAEGVLLGADGSVARGRSLTLPASGGSLRFAHGVGVVAVWNGREEDASASGFGGAADAFEISPPALLRLGASASAWRIAVAEPSLLSVRSGAPVAVGVFPPEGAEFHGEAFPEGARFDAVLPPGSARLEVRGLAGETPSGELEVRLAPLGRIGEGLGTGALLAPGTSRGWTFRLDAPRTVGLGVRADNGEVESTLFDARGRSLRRGVVIWSDLAAGDYTLVAAVPPGGEPAHVRPAAVGLALPGSGPPEEEARRYLALERGETPAAGAVVGSQAPELAIDPWQEVSESGDRWSGQGVEEDEEQGEEPVDEEEE